MQRLLLLIELGNKSKKKTIVFNFMSKNVAEDAFFSHLA